MQLVAYGAQDVYLTGNPQITFFKVVYRRHTNFAVEAIEQTFNGSVDFNKKTDVQITRNGDLITKMYLKATLESSCTEVNVMDASNNTVQMLINTNATTTLTAAAGGNEIDFLQGPGPGGPFDPVLAISDDGNRGIMSVANGFDVGNIIRIQNTTNNGLP